MNVYETWRMILYSGFHLMTVITVTWQHIHFSPIAANGRGNKWKIETFM